MDKEQVEQTARRILSEVEEMMSGPSVGIRRLPIVRVGGEDYFVDMRLREFRTVTPPVRPIEFISFGTERGQRMLARLVHQATCGRGAAPAHPDPPP